MSSPTTTLRIGDHTLEFHQFRTDRVARVVRVVNDGSYTAAITAKNRLLCTYRPRGRRYVRLQSDLGIALARLAWLLGAIDNETYSTVVKEAERRHDAQYRLREAKYFESAAKEAGIALTPAQRRIIARRRRLAPDEVD